MIAAKYIDVNKSGMFMKRKLNSFELGRIINIIETKYK